MNKDISDIHDLLQGLSWYFGNQGFDGQCCEDLSLVEYMALKKAYDIKNITIQELGDSLDITKSGISKIIDHLEKKFYVNRHQCSSDGRVCCVLPKEKGENAIYKISNRYNEYLHEILVEVDEDSIQNIKNTLELLIKAIQDKGFINQIRKG